MARPKSSAPKTFTAAPVSEAPRDVAADAGHEHADTVCHVLHAGLRDARCFAIRHRARPASGSGGHLHDAGPCPSLGRLLKSVAVALLAAFLCGPAFAAVQRPNVLFIIADDLTATALSCYGNTVCRTPNLDRLAARGMRFTRAFCNATYCGPSRASFMSGYYPHATGVLGYASPRPQIGDRATWSQHFKHAGYHAARVSKIFHMGVPGGVEVDNDGADDPASWTEKFNSPGPEWKAKGDGETLEGNPDGKRPVVGGNTFVVVEAEGDDLVHSDGKTAAKAVALIGELAGRPQPFFLAVGFVRPHVPFVAPAGYFEAFKPYDKMALPPKRPGAWDSIPKAGINYKTSVNMKMDERRQKKAVGGYYGAVTYMDAQVGKVLDALERSGQADNTIVIFTSDHGYHLGDHGLWMKQSLFERSARVPLIVAHPGAKAKGQAAGGVVELVDLYPTLAAAAGLKAPAYVDGTDLRPMLDNPKAEVKTAAYTQVRRGANLDGFSVRTTRWRYTEFGAAGASGRLLYDEEADPAEANNLAADPRQAATVAELSALLAAQRARK